MKELTGKKVLIADDEPDITEILEYTLTKEGCLVKVCHNGNDAVDLNRDFKPDLVILDVMMPGMDGIEACFQMKQDKANNDPKILFLTARSEEYSEVSGLDAGADDYITKPIRPRVLLSRIKAVLRRSGADDLKRENITQGEFSIDWNRYIILKSEQEFVLPKKEMELFSLLFNTPGKVFERETIMRKVWGVDVVVGDRTIDVHIRKLREKFGDHHFVTVKGVGYKFELN